MRENTSQPIYIKVSPLDLSKELFKMASKIIEGITICNSYIINKEELSIPIQEELEKTGKDRIAIHGNHLWNYTKQYIPIASNYFKKVSANGGIYNMNRIKKAFELGASSVQLCSALVFNGIDYLNKAIQPEIILASLSPRRKKILKNAGYKFKVISFNINEKKYFQKEIKKTVIKISLEKAKSVAKLIKYPAKIISADTMIDFEGKLIGKPKNKLEAFNLLKLLSGKTHSVYTGYCILNTKTNKIISDYVKTKLTFKKLSRKDIKDYINHYDVLTMAGAYNIESKQSYDLLVKSIEGSYYNVLGFPEEIFKYL
jgi:septum formation protein